MLSALLAATHVNAQGYDLILRNARIIDGTGSPWYRSDIAIRGDSIAQIAASIPGNAVRVIDVKGAVVAPGFVGIHTHAIRGIFQVPTADNYIRQGVTTLLEGPDGASPVPLKPFLDKPHQYAEGFSHVVVNGQVVFEAGAMTDARPGRVLYGPAHQGGAGAK